MQTQKQLNYFECINPVKMVIDIGCIGEVLEYELPINSINDIIKDLQEKHKIKLRWCKDFDGIIKQLKELYTGDDMDIDIWYEDKITEQIIYNTIMTLNGKIYSYNFVSCLDRDIFINEINKKDKHIKIFSSDKKFITSADEALGKAQHLLLLNNRKKNKNIGI